MKDGTSTTPGAAVDRRRLLAAAAGLLGAGAAASTDAQSVQAPPPEPPVESPSPAPAMGGPDASPEPEPPPLVGAPDWETIRRLWALDPSEIDLAAMLFASNPQPVRDAIDRHRRALDARPVPYLEANNKILQNRARTAAGRYFGVPGGDVALCESTTAGIGLLYNGLKLRPGHEVLTTVHDYYITHETLRMVAQRSGARVRKVELFDQAHTAGLGEIVGRLVGAIGPDTRVVALTWVHSSTGLKMPIRAICDAIAPLNAGRPPADRILVCVDGVHGFGVEDTTLPELGCDFLVAGCHKWMFGPRGTGVIFGTPHGWSQVTPTVPSFLAPNAYGAWIGGFDPGPTTAALMTPGGFKAFEHIWALSDMFRFHQAIGKAEIALRTRELAGRLKAGLAAMPHVRLQTPLDPALSAGVVSFDVAGHSADAVVERLRAHRIIGSAAPYARRHVRLAPSFRNQVQDLDLALAVIRALRVKPPPPATAPVPAP